MIKYIDVALYVCVMLLINKGVRRNRNDFISLVVVISRQLFWNNGQASFIGKVLEDVSFTLHSEVINSVIRVDDRNSKFK